MPNKYLVVAYGIVWLVFFVYAWSLSWRQDDLRKELEALKARIPEPPASEPRQGESRPRSDLDEVERGR